ncbi:hypothetical protein EJ357_04240 [Streptomyces cyaneochromogenes]|uniref:Nucleotidyltransferase family protein n=1 Tax=Streptomyces cyaneochromogenes TaxID=2496836 RepID=A0A3Q9EPL5_9ACTN|nr:hypothetical protein [Streptomyces cyaneochromogenes]AZQ32750.1 hypothetical protein EJ357_04240 [Streptomyces cyaneochromogenes]
MTENRESATPARQPGLPELRPVGESPLQPPAQARSQALNDHELPRDRSQAILEAAKQVGALLKRKGHRFALAGSVAVYAHGGSGHLQHDADFCVRRADAEAVARTLAEAGLTVRTPPEDWLMKTTCLGQDVDFLFELAHRPVTTDLLALAQDVPVDSVHMPVLPPTELMRGLVEAFSEHYCDFGPALAVARALREKVDWEDLRGSCEDEPMPAAFFFLLERLDVIAPREEPR